MKILIILLSLLLTACIESEIQSFTDPDYKYAKFTKLIIDTTSLPDTSRLEAEKVVMQRLKEANYDVIDINQILPPTRTIANEEAIKLLSESGYNNILKLSITGSESNTYLAGVYTYANANVTNYGNSAYGHANSYSTPIIASHGTTSIQAVIYDAKNGNKAWQANIVNKAEGTAFVGNVNSIANSVIGKLIDNLKADGHS